MATGFQLGPFSIRYYGLIILLGLILGLALSFRRASRRDLPVDFLVDALPWVILGGVLGARLWHIFTPPQSMVARGITTSYYLSHLLDALAIWKGGIGILGAILGGTLALVITAARKKAQTGAWLDVLAPGLALAQAVGRWGNFINQEVYGLPSSLPWAISIDPQHRLPGYSQVATYHPLFLYEFFWNLLNVGYLLWAERRWGGQLRPGALFLLYLIFYSLGRFGLEFLRLDTSLYRGVNLNQAAAAVITLAAGGALILAGRWKRAENSK